VRIAEVHRPSSNPDSKITTLNLWSGLRTSEAKKFIKIIESQCALNKQRALIENNIAGVLDLLTANPNSNDGNVTSVRDVNDLISQKLFALDKADKLNTDEVKKILTACLTSTPNLNSLNRHD
jgi:hypothetical protein